MSGINLVDVIGADACNGITDSTELAADIMSRPRPGIIADDWITACGAIMRERFPNQLRYLRNQADFYLDGTFSGFSALSATEQLSRYEQPVATKTRRGRTAGILARCWKYFGEEKYLKASLDLIQSYTEQYDDFPQLDPAPLAEWHAGFDKKAKVQGHSIGHIGENVVLALSALRTDLTAPQAEAILGFLWEVADFGYRMSRVGLIYNIPLHALVPTLLISIAVPEFTDAQKWRTQAVKQLEHLYCGHRGSAKGGYFKEGFSYQRVNHNLLMRCYLALKRAGYTVPPIVEERVIESMEFAAATVRNDGHVPRVGDGVFSGFWEHDIEQHEFLHLAAAEFNRQDFLDRAGTNHSHGPSEMLVVLMGEAGYTAWSNLKAPIAAEKKQSCHDMHYPGFQVLGAGRGMDAHYGLLNYANCHNHGHYDQGSIDITGLGRSLIVDPGTANYDSFDIKERYHSLLRLARLTRLGPRLDGFDHTGTLYADYSNSHIKSSGCWHTLYEGYRTTRTMTLCLPHGDSKGDVPAFWVIADTMEQTREKFPGENVCEIHEPTETYFNFYAPGTELGMDHSANTCWTRYDPVISHVEVIKGAYPNGERAGVDKAEIHRIFDYPDSDANIQVTGIFEDHTIGDFHELDAFLTLYGGRCPSPGVGFRWRGAMPHRAVYILVPFRGIVDQPWCAVSGQLSVNILKAVIQLPTGTCHLTINGIDGGNGSITLQTPDKEHTLAYAPSEEYKTRMY